MSECVKLGTCLVLVFLEEGKNFLRWKSVLHSTIVKQPMDTLKVCVPSLVYIIQNNLLYVSASHLDAATYQVSPFTIIVVSAKGLVKHPTPPPPPLITIVVCRRC